MTPCRWCKLPFIPRSSTTVYCSDKCRKERRKWYDSKKGKLYYAAHRQEVLDRTIVDYYTRTEDQTRRYNAKALERYHSKQNAIKRSKVYKQKLRQIPFDLGFSILSEDQMGDTMFVVENKDGSRRRERLSHDGELVEW